MRLLFATTRGAGHVGPLVPFARAAAAAGPRRPLRRAPLGGACRAAAPGSRSRRWASPAAATAEAGVGAACGRPRPRPGWPRWCRTSSSGCTRGWRCRGCSRWSSAVPAGRGRARDARVRLGAGGRARGRCRRCGSGSTSTRARTRTPRLLGVATPALDALRPALGLAPDPEATRDPRVAGADAGARVHERGGRRRCASATTVPPPARRPSCRAWGDPAAPLVYVSFGSEAAASHHFPGVYRRAALALARAAGAHPRSRSATAATRPSSARCRRRCGWSAGCRRPP